MRLFQQSCAGREARSLSCCGGHGDHDHDAGATKVRDPVCGMTVDPATSKHRFDHHGETFHFCSAGCRTKFAADPAKYLAKRQGDAEPEMPAGTIYTCPMHPEIRQVGPGSCPICGMALEPEVASLDSGAQSRARRHDAAVLDRRRAGAAGGRAGDGRPSRRPARLDRSDAVELDPARLRHAGGAVGRLAVLRARLAIAADAQPQHVHADRDGHRRRLCLQRDRHRRAADLPGDLPRP